MSFCMLCRNRFSPLCEKCHMKLGGIGPGVEDPDIYFEREPDGVCVLTMAVDTQDNRYVYEVAGWGEGQL